MDDESYSERANLRLERFVSIPNSSLAIAADGTFIAHDTSLYHRLLIHFSSIFWFPDQFVVTHFFSIQFNLLF